MSYIVAVKRIISMQELLALVEHDPSLRVVRQDADTADLAWTGDHDECEIQFAQGELQATSPSDAAARKMGEIAEALGAAVVGEEDLIPSSSLPIQRGIFTNRSTWIGWPVLVIVLGALLVWRW